MSTDPSSNPAASDAVEESSFPTDDGTELFYRKWPARSGKPRGAIILLHRGHEHGGRVAHLVEELGLGDFTFYAWDARGHGRSPGERGYSPSFAASVRDLDSFVKHICKTGGFAIEDIAVIAQSVGAVLAATWVHDYAPRIRALVLASPAFSVKLYVPFAREGIWLWQKLKGQFFVNSYVKAKFLTHDPARIVSFDNDPLVTRAIASNILLDLYTNAERVVADARAIIVPTQLLISGSDWVVRHGPQHRFYENLAHPLKERHVLKGLYHDPLGEKERAIAVAHARRFILACFDTELEPLDVTNAHQTGFTRDEQDRLSSPHDLLSLKGLYWAIYRSSIRFSALFSKGLKTGVETGFDSGSTLDYVYENEPRGMGPGGRLIDKQFLNAIGWRGIRQRKLHLQELIGFALTRLKDAGHTTHILDIAAGHGRYVLDAIAKSAVKPTSVRLQDYAPINVGAGRKSIAERGIQDIASFHQADAFDAAELAAIQPAPDLAIVSGLYELFPDNALIKRSLGGLATSMQSGSMLIYTNQPWHPQLEMIARALTSHRGGEAWVMRRRTQAEMDQLVAAAGFRKIDQLVDEWGIFTVSIAERT
ncbi:bifunctional alpha/beta hydrolase/class I SAM-dependent methyltransferase [Phyllobacterium sp.]|uniref:bifunctional alpha/beta hydrolase/class I SAM-dependent methyltransferase n=1 Tax=Phyllobacterium sp. TaxID=1871046 RepID=UPI0031FBD427|nr:bifunctional alpha/beta hydrolase/class I SAM-dependent methyltransferase [Phyllobacterium sp.]